MNGPASMLADDYATPYSADVQAGSANVPTTLDEYDDHSSTITRAGLRQTNLTDRLQHTGRKKTNRFTGMGPPNGPLHSSSASIYSVSTSNYAPSVYHPDNSMPNHAIPPPRMNMIPNGSRTSLASNHSGALNGNGKMMYPAHGNMYQNRSINGSNPNIPNGQAQQQGGYYNPQQQQNQQYRQHPGPGPNYHGPTQQNGFHVQQRYQTPSQPHPPFTPNHQYRPSNVVPPPRSTSRELNFSPSQPISSPGIRSSSTMDSNSPTELQRKQSARLSINSALSFLHIPNSNGDNIKADEIDEEVSESSSEDEHIKGLEDENEALRKRLHDLETKQKLLKDVEVRNSELVGKLRNYEEENDQLKKELDSIKSARSSINDDLHSKISQMEENYDEAMSSYTLLEHHNDKLNDYLDKLKDKNTELSAEVKILQQKLGITNDTNEKLAASFKEFIQKIPDNVKSDDSLKDIDVSTFPKEIQEIYQSTMNNSQLANTIKTVKKYDQDGMINSDEQLLQLFRDEVKALSTKVQKLEQSKSQIERSLREQLLKERSTIKKMSMHRSYSDQMSGLSLGRTYSNSPPLTPPGSATSFLFNERRSVSSGNSIGNSMRLIDVVEPKFSIKREED